MPEEEEETSDILERLDVLSDLIEENIRLTKDTNRIVREVRRTGRIAFWFKILLWIIVLGLPIFFLGPILKYVHSVTGFEIPTNTSALGIPSADQIQKAVADYKTKNTASP